MREILSAGAGAILWLGCSAANATPPDTSSMPQLALPQALPPEDASPAPLQFAFTATAATNYIFRGVSQTENDPAIFGAVRATYDNFYLVRHRRWPTPLDETTTIDNPIKSTVRILVVSC